MKLNGTIYHLEQPVILLDLLNEYGFQTQRIAVEMNGAIIPKATYEHFFRYSGFFFHFRRLEPNIFFYSGSQPE